MELIRESHRHHGGNSSAVPQEEDKPRGIWKLARVTSLITGKDGHTSTRGAILHVPSSGGSSALQRPIQFTHLKLWQTTIRKT